MGKRYIIELKDDARQGFLEELLGQLDFVRLRPDRPAKPLKLTKQERKMRDDLRAAVKEMRDDLSGKRRLPTLKEAIHELRR